MNISSFMWMGVGFLGQGLFTARFLVQWISSEKKRKSIIPVAFWYFSLAGGITLLVYAIHRQDPVFITGQAAGIVIYIRNLVLISKERKKYHECTIDKR
ncbi:MAG: lipid A biosynthesis protein [Deltaproteobacteria bacterium]|nr:lipid A biosynthesis protein [Deltaproteobacteria bacterium]